MYCQIAATAAEAAGNCANRLLEILSLTIDASGRASLAVSGGTTPKPMFEAMARSSTDWTKVHLFWVDERAVPASSDDSNYKLAFDHFIVPAAFPMANVHRIHGELDPAEAAQRYTADIAEFFHLSAGELPKFDAIHLGMGEEGHTASLFPGSPLLDDRNGLAAPVFAPKPPNWRVTTLPGLLLEAKHMLLLVAGADKNPVVRQVASGFYDPKTYPVQLIAQEGAGVQWFLDEAAAAGI